MRSMLQLTGVLGCVLLRQHEVSVLPDPERGGAP